MAGSDAPGASTRWRPGFALDVPTVLAPLRRGKADPAYRVDGRGRTWLGSTTADGPATLVLSRDARGDVLARAWGPGAERVIAGVPALLGAHDDVAGFAPHHPAVAEAMRRLPGLRLPATGRVWDVLLAAILEQKVTGYEARRSWRELCRRYGTPAPGPVPERMFVPPTPRALRAVTDWQWHAAGVDGARRHTIVAAARVAESLERAAETRGGPGRKLLRTVPGIGVWTAAEVAQRSWGDPDAVSLGDFHIPAVVGHALLGAATDDEGMLAALRPYAPQRQRAVRYLEAVGHTRPRFGPRLPARDYRAM